MTNPAVAPARIASVSTPSAGIDPLSSAAEASSAARRVARPSRSVRSSVIVRP